jgi:hypothetical protein
MPNLRQKGKIPRSEWPKILTRYGKGETIAQIGRDYGCTAPAIRYIVKRSGLLKSAPDHAPSRQQVAVRRRERNGLDAAPSERAPRGKVLLGAQVRQRVSGDVASFLVALDQAVLDGSRESLASLQEATDSLMRSAARTRLELERLLTRRDADAHEHSRTGTAQDTA